MTALPRPDEQPLLTVAELVQLVPSLKRSSVYAAIDRGEIPHVRIGRLRFIPTAALRRAWGLDPDVPDISGSQHLRAV